jgi:hypothetical protein
MPANDGWSGLGDLLFVRSRATPIENMIHFTKSQGTEFSRLDDCKILPFVRREQVKLKSSWLNNLARQNRRSNRTLYRLFPIAIVHNPFNFRMKDENLDAWVEFQKALHSFSKTGPPALKKFKGNVRRWTFEPSMIHTGCLVL